MIGFRIKKKCFTRSSSSSSRQHVFFSKTLKTYNPTCSLFILAVRKSKNQIQCFTAVISSSLEPDNVSSQVVDIQLFVLSLVVLFHILFSPISHVKPFICNKILNKKNVNAKIACNIWNSFLLGKLISNIVYVPNLLTKSLLHE